MKKERKRYSAEQKVAILRWHVVDREPTSKPCDELGLQPSLFYRWRKEFFENDAPTLIWSPSAASTQSVPPPCRPGGMLSWLAQRRAGRCGGRIMASRAGGGAEGASSDCANSAGGRQFRAEWSRFWL